MDETRSYGTYVALEGIDGSGKSSLVRALVDLTHGAADRFFSVPRHAWLDAHDSAVILDFYRGGMPHVSEVREAYVRDWHAAINNSVRPALCQTSVVQDRCYLSNVVNLAVVYGLDPAETAADYHVRGALLPAVVVLVDASPQQALRRIAERGEPPTRWESREFVERSADAYDLVLAHLPPSVRTVRVCNDGSRDLVAVAEEVLTLIRSAVAS